MNLKEIFKNYINNVATKEEERMLQIICRGVGITVAQCAIIYLLMNGTESVVENTNVDPTDIDLSIFERNHNRQYQEV